MNLTPEERERLMNDYYMTRRSEMDVLVPIPGADAIRQQAEERVITALPLALADLAAVTRERDELRRDLEEWKSHYSVMARACGNWREWPKGTVSAEPMKDYTHDDWKAGARAIIERDELQRRVDAAETRVGKSSASNKDFRNGWNQCRGEFLSALARKEDA